MKNTTHNMFSMKCYVQYSFPLHWSLLYTVLDLSRRPLPLFFAFLSLNIKKADSNVAININILHAYVITFSHHEFSTSSEGIWWLDEQRKYFFFTRQVVAILWGKGFCADCFISIISEMMVIIICKLFAFVSLLLSVPRPRSPPALLFTESCS